MDPDAAGVELAGAQASRTPRAAGRRRRSGRRPAPRRRRASGRGCGARPAASRAGGPEALQDRALIQQRERLGLEPGRPAGQAEVQLGGAPAEHAGHGGHDRVVARCIRLGDEALDLAASGRSWLHSHRSASLSDHVMDNDRAGGCLAPELQVERAGHARHVLEAPRPQVERQRHVGVVARRDAAGAAWRSGGRRE